MIKEISFKNILLMLSVAIETDKWKQPHNAAQRLAEPLAKAVMNNMHMIPETATEVCKRYVSKPECFTKNNIEIG